MVVARVHTGRIASILLVAITASACDHEPVTWPERAVAVRSAAQEVMPRTIRPEERAFDEIATSAPGFGGYYFTPSGDAIAWVKEPGQDGLVRGMVESVQKSLVANRKIKARGTLQLRRANYTFWELARARDFLLDSARGKVTGLHGIDLDERSNRVLAFVEPERATAALSDLRTLLLEARLDTAIVELRRQTAPRYLRGSAAPAPFQAYSLISGADTIVGGLQWSKSGGALCSVGIVATYGGSTGMFSATHCSSTWFGVDGTVAYLASGQGQAFASETVDPNGTMCFLISPWGNWACRYSDAAFWGMNGNVPAARGLIARTANSAGPGGTSAGSIILDSTHPYFPVIGTTGALSQGETVHKMGYRTGWTMGYIENTCVDTWDNDHVFKCQYAGSFYSDSGDSGGAVFQRDPVTGDGILAGILSSRSGNVTLFSPWWRVSDEFGGGINATRGYALSTPSLSGYVDSSSPVVSWSAVSGATEYQLLREWFRNSTGEYGDLESLGAVSSPAIDMTMSVTAYTGSSIPGPHTPGYVAYYLIARNKSDRSQTSSVRYFQLAP